MYSKDNYEQFILYICAVTREITGSLPVIELNRGTSQEEIISEPHNCRLYGSSMYGM